MNTKLLLTVPEAAECLGLGRSKVYQLMTSGQLRSVSIGRARRIPVDAIAALLKELELALEQTGGQVELDPDSST